MLQEKKLSLAETFTRAGGDEGEGEECVNLGSELVFAVGGQGGAGSDGLPSRVPGTKWHGGEQSDACSSLSAPEQPTEICYQLVPPTPGDISSRALGSPGYHPQNSSSSPLVLQFPHKKHLLPRLETHSWCFSLLRALYPIHYDLLLVQALVMSKSVVRKPGYSPSL